MDTQRICEGVHVLAVYLYACMQERMHVSMLATVCVYACFNACLLVSVQERVCARAIRHCPKKTKLNLNFSFLES